MNSRVSSRLARITPSLSLSITKARNIPLFTNPSRGEQPLWDFPENTLAGREVAAYLVSEHLAFTLSHSPPCARTVPTARVRSSNSSNTIPNITTSVSATKTSSFSSLSCSLTCSATTQTAKGSHVFFENDTHKLYAIDHGICFHEDDKLRTVLWDFSGQKIPEDLLACLSLSRRPAH